MDGQAFYPVFYIFRRINTEQEPIGNGLLFQANFRFSIQLYHFSCHEFEAAGIVKAIGKCIWFTRRGIYKDIM